MRKNILLKILIIMLLIIMLGIVSSSNSFGATSTQVYARNFEDIQIEAIIDNATDTTAASVSINVLIGAVLTFIQFAGFLICLILIIITVIKHIILLIKKKNSTSFEEQKRLEEKIIKNKKILKFAIILFVILFFIQMCLSIIKPTCHNVKASPE